ncbi:hypothetical protein ACO2RV_02015 [Ancylobacter sp. VNQ12]|uniref:hypothetical protein n=1 Tax=Ancylobacter sp. VNQ12 TaxID=3400920 RepID=UPI003C0CA342
MFGISPIGWVHTLGSLPAIPVAAYMFARHGRIVPWSRPGIVYFIAMVIGASTVFLVAKSPPAAIAGAVTLALLFAGYGVGAVALPPRAARYIETICLSLTAFLLMLPTVSEILRRVPDGHPFVTDPTAPLLVGAQLAILLALVVGLSAQLIHLRRQASTAGRR